MKPAPVDPKQPQRTQVLTPKEAAKYLGVHVITIYRLIKTSDIPASKVGGQWRFRKALLDEWLLKRMNVPKS